MDVKSSYREAIVRSGQYAMDSPWMVSVANPMIKRAQEL